MGERLGNYRLVRRLAIGGMAEVFLAESDAKTGPRQVVVKRILSHLAEDPRFLELFITEAKVSVRLAHPHIAQLFDLGAQDGVPYLAMEYVDGPSLRTVVQRCAATHTELPLAVCARLVAQAADALAYAHELCDEEGKWLGLVHRDVSPENILVSSAGVVKVVDFGIAKAAALNPSKSASLRGKYAYMAPEQLRTGKGRIDRRVDVFSLGVVLYELATGHKPFDARGELAMMRAILFSPHVPPALRRPDFPKPLEAVIERALGKEREARYPACRQLQEDLEAFIRQRGEDASPARIAKLVQTLDAIPRTPSGMFFPPAQPVQEPTRTSPTAAVVADAALVPEVTPSPSESTISRPAARALEPTRITGEPQRVPTAETRIQPMELEPDPLMDATTSVRVKAANSPARAEWWPRLLVAALTAGGAIAMAHLYRADLRELFETTLHPPPVAPPGPVPLPVPPAAVPQERSLAQKARLTVSSTPAGDVWIDGQQIGPSPASIENHVPGEVRVAVRDPAGTFSKELTFFLVPGDNGTKEIVIERLPVQFEVPGRTRVYLDGVDLGEAPLSDVFVYEGAHSVRLVHRLRGLDVQSALVVAPGRPNVFRYDLGP